MSNKSIGAAFEKKCMKLMESFGFAVERANPKLQFLPGGKVRSLAHDFFGCADLIGVKQGEPRTYFVQCTTGDAAVRRLKMSQVKWDLGAQTVQVWKRSKKDKQSIVVYQLVSQGDHKAVQNEHTWDTYAVSFKDLKSFEEVLDCAVYEQSRTAGDTIESVAEKRSSAGGEVLSIRDHQSTAGISTSEASR